MSKFFNMKFTAQQIAELINGTVEGDVNQVIRDVSKIEEGRPETLTFLANPKYEQHIYNTEASVVIVNNSFKPEKPVKTTLIRVEDAYQALAKLLQLYESSLPKKTGIEQPSYIEQTASVGDFVYIGAFAYISEKAKIGNNVQIWPGAFVGEGVEIGDDTITLDANHELAGKKLNFEITLVEILADGDRSALGLEESLEGKPLR